MTPPLVDRTTGEVVQAAHLNDIKSYIEDADYRVNTDRLEINGVEVITDTGKIVLPVNSDGNDKNWDGMKNVTFTAEYDNGSSGSTETIDWNNGQKQKVTLDDDCSFSFTAPTGGVGHLQLRLINSGDSRAPTFDGGGLNVFWSGSAAPTWSATDGAIDIVSFYYNGSDYFGVGSVGFGQV